MTAPSTRAEEASRILAYARERLADLGDAEVSIATDRSPRVAALGGPVVLRISVEILIDAPDAQSTL